MSAKNEIVGFVGLGSMGGSLAQRLAKAGINLVVYDINPATYASFSDNVSRATSPKDVADHAAIVFTCLPSLESTQAVANMIADGSAIQLYVHLGTVGFEFTRDIERVLASKNVAMIDAPITGGPARARTGTLTVIASGPKNLVERAAPYMETYSNKLVHVSETVGDAQKMKIVNNILAAANLALAAEALVVGAKCGLDPAMMVEVFNHGSGQNSATLSKLPNHILPGTFDFGSTMSIVEKDLTAYIAEGKRHGVTTPLGQAVLDVFTLAQERGSAKDDMTTVIRHMEVDAGVECRAPS